MKSDTPVVVEVRAIDVGYFSTKISLGRKIIGNSAVIGTALFPSLAPRLPSGMAPQSALNSRTDGTVVEVDGVNYFVGRDATLFSAGNEPREVLADYGKTDKYLALLRGALHYIFKDTEAHSELVIRHLVLGLPLTTFEDNRDHLSARAMGEHLLPDPSTPGAKCRVTVEKVTVIVQPQGALINHGYSNNHVIQDSWALVVDPGGGTLDWYLARGRQPNWMRSGAYPMAMLACAYAVADRIDPTWRDNYEIISRIDRAIREKTGSFQTAGETYQMAAYEPAIESVLKETTDKMVAKLGSMDNLDTILFTGGGAKLFHGFMSRRYPKLAKIMRVDDDPVFANVKGFQLAGEMLAAPSRH